MINPGTPVETILPVLSNVDYVLVMTVNPGFGGQSFIEQCINKIEQLNQLKHENNLTFDIEVDGGINDQTSKVCIEQGATMLVTGSYFFKQDNYAQVTETLKGWCYGNQFTMFSATIASISFKMKKECKVGRCR